MSATVWLVGDSLAEVNGGSVRHIRVGFASGERTRPLTLCSSVARDWDMGIRRSRP
jgi:hypothetical protein